MVPKIGKTITYIYTADRVSLSVSLFSNFQGEDDTKGPMMIKKTDPFSPLRSNMIETVLTEGSDLPCIRLQNTRSKYNTYVFALQNEN